MKFPIIETERLILREFTKSDIETLFYLWSDEEITKYNDMAPLKDMKGANELFDLFYNRFYNMTGLRWCIVLKENDKFIGDIGLNGFDGSNRSTQVGYTLHKDFWRKGIMKEALKAVLLFSFQDLTSIDEYNEHKLNRIEAETIPENIASEKLLQSVGFVEEGVLRQGRWWAGKLADVKLFSLLRDDVFSEDGTNRIGW